MSAKIFVGNLNYQTTQDQLADLFAEVGQVVEVFVPSDRNTGRPRGFAFVEFADPSVVPDAIEKFDGYELGGRPLRINEAQDRPQRAPRIPSFNDGEGGGGGGGGGYHGQKGRPKPKGSRRNARGKKRSL